jgi:hypothetical protein
MLGQKNKTHIIVGKDLAPLTETQTRDNLSVGQIGVFKNGKTTAIDGTTDLTAGDRFKIVYKDVDGNIVESPMYDYDLLKRKKAKNYAASTEQLSYLGYNGTTGTLEVTNSNDYIIHMFRKDWSKTWGEHSNYKLASAFTSDATATEYEVAVGLTANAVKNFEEEKLRSGTTVTTVGLINSTAVTAANAIDNNTTVVKGVNAVTVATAATYNTGTAIAVGDFLRIGTVAGGTALTSNIYKVTAVNSLVLTLDRKVTDASGTYATATDDIEVIPKATILAATGFGISFKSEPVKFSPGLFKFQNVTFELSLTNFGATPVTESTKPYKGVGTYKEVAELEWELRGNRGEGYKVASYPVSQNLNATSGKTYDMISLDFENDNARSLNGKEYSFHSLVIATENESVSTIHTDLKDILNIS